MSTNPPASPSPTPYRHVDVEQIGDVWCARLRQTQLDEQSVDELGEELIALVVRENCRKLVLCLGPEEIVCLYSVLLSKLVLLHKRLQDVGGALKLADVAPATRGIFEACNLTGLFDFVADRATALEQFGAPRGAQPVAPGGRR